MRARVLSSMVLPVLLLLLLATRVEACSCAGPGSPCQAFGGASAVFVGVVSGVTTTPRGKSGEAAEVDWTPRVFKFVVEQPFLGVEGTEVEVATGMGGGDCGYGFRQGERYLVYAYRNAKNDRLVTSICTRTKPYEKADEDIEYLRSLSSRAPGVTIQGEVVRQRQSVKKGNSEPVGGLASAALVIEGEGERHELRTDAKGRYLLSGLRPGKYKITLSLPDELSVYRPTEEVTVADRGCAVVNYYVSDNGRISGKVLDIEGQPVAGVLVGLIEADEPDIERDYAKLERTDAAGEYKFSVVPPGRYLLGIHLNRYPEPKDPTNAYPPTFYPGVARMSEAEVISLSAGENLRDRDLRLLPRRAASVIKGTVVWADGKPVANASVSFRDVTDRDPRSNFGSQADEQGNFSIETFVGRTIVIEVRSNRPYVGDPRRFEPMERAEPLTVVVANPSETVRLVITKLR